MSYSIEAPRRERATVRLRRLQYTDRETREMLDDYDQTLSWGELSKGNASS